MCTKKKAKKTVTSSHVSPATSSTERDLPPQPGQQTDGKLDTSKLRRTNRISKSCYSCKRRKVKCNFEIPCDRCIARNRAHMCSREPVIVDGMLVNAPGDEKELKFSQENEVLKKKIRGLEETIMKLKQTKGVDDEDFSRRERIRRKCLNNELPNEKLDIERSNITELSEISSKRQKVNDESETGNYNNEESRNWDSYSVTLSLLTKGLAEGMQDEGDKNLDFNTEEWSTVNNQRLIDEIKKDDMKSDIWNYQLRIIKRIGKKQSDIILKKTIPLNFLFNVIDPKAFMKDYEDYWVDESNYEKHITPFYSKNNKKYLYLGHYYALLCIGLYYADESLQEELEFTDEEWDFFPRVFFSCALECLFRGRYMTFMNLKTVQLYCLIKMCAHALGGVHFLNCLTCTTSYIARQINIDKIKPKLPNIDTDKEVQLRIRVWWSLVMNDWSESHGRYSLISENSFTTPLPNKWYIHDQVLSWSNYFQRVFIKTSIIKKKYYFVDEVSKNETTLESLKKADVELRVLNVEIDRDFNMYMDKERLENDTDFRNMIDYSRYLIKFIMLHEIMDVNRQMSVFMTYKDWTESCYKTCYDCAKTLIQEYTSTSVPLNYKKAWFVPQFTISAAVFLLVDCMLNKQIIRYQKETIALVKRVLPVLSSYKQAIRPAMRGVYVIQKLINLMLGTDRMESLSKLRSLTKREKSVAGTAILSPDFDPVGKGSGKIPTLDISKSKVSCKPKNQFTFIDNGLDFMKKNTKPKPPQRPKPLQSRSTGAIPRVSDSTSNVTLHPYSMTRRVSFVDDGGFDDPSKSPEAASSTSSLTYQLLQKFNQEQRREPIASPNILPIDNESILFHHGLQTVSASSDAYKPMPPPNLMFNQPTSSPQLNAILNAETLIEDLPLSNFSPNATPAPRFNQNSGLNHDNALDNYYKTQLQFQQTHSVCEQTPSSQPPTMASSMPDNTDNNNHSQDPSKGNDNVRGKKLATTILDILGDNGWGEFLDSIDDLAPSYDVRK